MIPHNHKKRMEEKRSNKKRTKLILLSLLTLCGTSVIFMY